MLHLYIYIYIHTYIHTYVHAYIHTYKITKMKPPSCCRTWPNPLSQWTGPARAAPTRPATGRPSSPAAGRAGPPPPCPPCNGATGGAWRENLGICGENHTKWRHTWRIFCEELGENPRKSEGIWKKMLGWTWYFWRYLAPCCCSTIKQIVAGTTVCTTEQ